MKNVYFIISSMILGLFLNGCSNDEDLFSDQHFQNVTLVAQQDEFTRQFSRSIIYEGQETGEDYVFMQWMPQDKIGVFSVRKSTGENPDNNVMFTNQEIENSNKASFSGKLGYFDSSCKMYAYYPYNQATCTQTIEANIDQRFIYEDLSSLAMYDHKIADVVNYSPNELPGDNPFKPYVLEAKFKQLTSLLRFNLNLNELGNIISKKLPTSNLTDCTLKSVKITISDPNTKDYVPLTGAFRYELTKSDKGFTLPGFNPQKENSLTVDIAAKPTLSETNFTFYAIVAPNLTKNKKLICNILVTNSEAEYNLQFGAKVLVDFEPGNFYHVDINNATYKKAETYSPEDAVVHVKKLNIEETANCYVVSKVGTFKFNANVIGNGQKGIIPNAGFHTETATINPKSAKLLWQDTDNFISKVTLKKNGWVEYVANKNVGNAVIAVYDGEHATGNILWSWHIWGIGDEPLTTELFTNKAGYSFEVMDRNLGAHSKKSDVATLYQWGRKDPFPNTSTYYPGIGSPSEDITSFPVQLAPTAHRIVDLIQVPNKLAWASDNGPFTTPNKLLWGDDNTATRFTWTNSFANDGADNRWQHVKTIYDPSPVGFRVANKFTFTDFVTYNHGEGKHINDINARKNDLQNEIIFEKGCYFFKNSNDHEGSFFAATGFRYAQNGSLQSRGVNAKYWTSGCGISEDQSSAFIFNKPEISECHATTVYVSNNRWLGAYAVRCVRDDINLVVNK